MVEMTLAGLSSDRNTSQKFSNKTDT